MGEIAQKGNQGEDSSQGCPIKIGGHLKFRDEVVLRDRSLLPPVGEGLGMRVEGVALASRKFT
ncbi:MAG: hypothetical protein A3J38_03220 [Gammaproteobacteria bacterium RIFCSPHIGHO2_12_FULL_45_9]|nr:MAG: hypothetical protein A3J38_03220 [Gammaproteobacteria bacterium RIFCSPHIGHO2_12_FULL_45_9]